jgi:hypothetical protein
MHGKAMAVPYLPLERWNRRWELEGAQVRCKTCNVLQEGKRAVYSFAHRLACPTHTASAQYPLRELYQILKDQIDLGLA